MAEWGGVGQVVPRFRLPVAGGGEARLTAYRGRANLALFLFPEGDGPATRRCLGAVAARLADYRARQTQPLAILGGPLAVVEAVQGALELPFPLAADGAGRLLAALATRDADGQPVPAVVLTDRYGEARVHLTGWAALAPEGQATLLEWLTYIDCLCAC